MREAVSVEEYVSTTSVGFVLGLSPPVGSTFGQSASVISLQVMTPSEPILTILILGVWDKAIEQSTGSNALYLYSSPNVLVEIEYPVLWSNNFPSCVFIK